MPLLQRTIQLTLATCLSIFLASFLGAEYAITAGTIAILNVSVTRQATAQQAYRRFLSAILALAIGALVFYFLGYTIWSFALFLLFYIPISFRFNIDIGLSVGTVLVTHLLLEKSVAPTQLANELLILIIGSLFPLLVMVYRPNRKKELDAYHIQVEELFQTVLSRFVYYLETENGQNNATSIRKLEEVLRQATETAYLYETDTFRTKESTYHIDYFEMRHAQLFILQDMALNIRDCHLSVEEGKILAQLFQLVADNQGQEHPAIDQMHEIHNYYLNFRTRPLPQTRLEFEARAALLQLLKDLHHFVQLKLDFSQQYPLDKIKDWT